MNWVRVRAILITLVLAWQGVLAMPMPNRVHPALLNTPDGREEFDNWYQLLSGLGLPWSRGEAEDVLIRFTNQVNDVYDVVVGPLEPLEDLTGTGQGWMFFAVADSHPNRLEVWRQADGEWAPLYVAGDSEHDVLAPILRYRRVRGIHDLTRKQTRTYKHLVRWIAAEVFATRPEVTVVEVRQVREHTVVPGAHRTKDRTWTRRRVKRP